MTGAALPLHQCVISTTILQSEYICLSSHHKRRILTVEAYATENNHGVQKLQSQQNTHSVTYLHTQSSVKTV